MTCRWLCGALVLLFAHASAATMQSPVQRECEQIGFVAATAAGNRASGATREQLFQVLPSLEQPEDKRDSSEYRVLRAMHEIVGEVFDYSPLNKTAYMVYKTESCYQAAWGGTAPKPFARAHEELVACSTLEHNELIACAMRVAGATPDGA